MLAKDIFILENTELIELVSFSLLFSLSCLLAISFFSKVSTNRSNGFQFFFPIAIASPLLFGQDLVCLFFSSLYFLSAYTIRWQTEGKAVFSAVTFATFVVVLFFYGIDYVYLDEQYFNIFTATVIVSHSWAFSSSVMMKRKVSVLLPFILIVPLKFCGANIFCNGLQALLTFGFIYSVFISFVNSLSDAKYTVTNEDTAVDFQSDIFEKIINEVSLADNACVEIYDQSACIKWVSAGFESVHGKSVDELIEQKGGRRMFDLYASKKVLSKFELAKKTHEVQFFGISDQFCSKESEQKNEIVLIPIISNERITNFVLVNRKKQAAIGLPEAMDSKVSEKADPMSTVAGSIAHDLNNILTPIIGNCEMLLEESAGDEKQYKPLCSILTASQRARVLVSQILSYYRNFDQKITKVNITDVLSDSLKLFSSSIEPSFDLKVIRNVPNAYVKASLNHLNQIFINLLTIVKQSLGQRAGNLIVEQSLIHLDETGFNLESGVYVSVSFFQSFELIEEDELTEIFNNQHKIKSRSIASNPGFSVISGILDEYGGELFVEKIEGKGFAYQILLPSVSSAIEKSSIGRSTERKKKGTILVVDDEVQITELLMQRLTRDGYTVQVANDPLDALKKYSSDPNGYDLVISDQTMPQMTGEDLAKSILSIEPDQKIMLMTGYSEDISLETIGAMGVKELIYKPFDLSAIVNQIHRITGTQELDLDEIRKNLF